MQPRPVTAEPSPLGLQSSGQVLMGGACPGDTQPHPRSLGHRPPAQCRTTACVHIQEQSLFPTIVLLLMISILKEITIPRAFPGKAGLLDLIVQDQH